MVDKMKLSSPSTALPIGRGKRFAVVVSRFNSDVTDRLLAGCRATFRAAGVADRDVRVIHAPGAFELPFLCRRLATSRRYHAVVALGCIVRGQTPHDRYIAQAVAQGIMAVGLETGVPVVFGVLTPLNARQARARSGAGDANKGVESARAALEMASGDF